MKATVERIDKNRVMLEVEVEALRVDQALEKAYRKVAKKVNIPGFRKGKAPRRIIENYLGKEPIYNEAVETIVPEAYIEAIDESKVEPIDQPDVELVQLEEGRPLIFKAKVDVKPEVELENYKGLQLEKKTIEVTDEDVQQQLKNLQQRYAKLEILEEGTLQEGDIAVIDYRGYIDGQTFKGGEKENFNLEIGSKTFIPGFEEQLVGSKSGDRRQLNVTFPPDYHHPELAGKEAIFFVDVKEIKRKKFAPLDDEFAKDVSELETLQELREDLKNRLKKAAEAQVEQNLKDQAVNKAVENTKVEIPEVLIERRSRSFLEDMKKQMLFQGFQWENYLKVAKRSEEDILQDFRERAQASVKTELVLEAIAKKEALEVTQEELEEQINKMAENSGQSVETVKTMLAAQDRMSMLEYNSMMDKTINFLVEHASIKEIKDEEIKEASGEEAGAHGGV